MMTYCIILILRSNIRDKRNIHVIPLNEISNYNNQRNGPDCKWTEYGVHVCISNMGVEHMVTHVKSK